MGKLWTDEETTPFATPWRTAWILPDDGRKEGVVDGDSFRMLIDVGFGCVAKAYTRLLAEGVLTTPDDKSDDGVDAWETRGVEREKGLLAEARAEELLPPWQKIRVWSFKGEGDTGKYGRWLVVVLVEMGGGWRSVGDILIDEGHAEFETY